jgi:ABC-type amino acid transport substrate-binding protein
MIRLTNRRMFLCNAVLAGGVFGAFTSHRASAGPALKTVTPGVLTVAMNGDMPMTGIKDGKLIGTDGEMIALIGQKLGLSVRPSLMEWSATIESIRSGRAD